MGGVMSISRLVKNYSVVYNFKNALFPFSTVVFFATIAAEGSKYVI